MPVRNYRQVSTGKKVKGVTSHDILEKPGLLFWAFAQGLSNFERLMGILAEIAKQDTARGYIIQPIIKDFKTTDLYEKRNKAADAGTLGHLFVEHHNKGLVDPPTDGLDKEVVKKAEGCYLAYLDWEKSNKVKILGIEVGLTSEKYPFGGTIDYVIQSAMTPSDMVELLDLKTGKDVYFSARMQVRGAYKKLWEEHDERKVSGCHILRLGENGEFVHQYYPSSSDDEEYWEIFKNCMNISERLERLGEKL